MMLRAELPVHRNSTLKDLAIHECLLARGTSSRSSARLAAGLIAIGADFDTGVQQADSSCSAGSARLSSPNTGTESSVWNVSQAMPCGSVTQYLSERA